MYRRAKTNVASKTGRYFLWTSERASGSSLRRFHVLNALKIGLGSLEPIARLMQLVNRGKSFGLACVARSSTVCNRTDRGICAASGGNGFAGLGWADGFGSRGGLDSLEIVFQSLRGEERLLRRCGEPGIVAGFGRGTSGWSWTGRHRSEESVVGKEWR